MIIMALDDFKEKTTCNHLSIEVKELACIAAIIKNVVLSELHEQCGIKSITRIQIVIIVLWNGQDSHPFSFQLFGHLKNIIGAKGDMLHAATKIFR